VDECKPLPRGVGMSSDARAGAGAGAGRGLALPLAALGGLLVGGGGGGDSGGGQARKVEGGLMARLFAEDVAGRCRLTLCNAS